MYGAETLACIAIGDQNRPEEPGFFACSRPTAPEGSLVCPHITHSNHSPYPPSSVRASYIFILLLYNWINYIFIIKLHICICICYYIYLSYIMYVCICMLFMYLLLLAAPPTPRKTVAVSCSTTSTTVGGRGIFCFSFTNFTLYKTRRSEHVHTRRSDVAHCSELLNPLTPHTWAWAWVSTYDAWPRPNRKIVLSIFAYPYPYHLSLLYSSHNQVSVTYQLVVSKRGRQRITLFWLSGSG